MKERLDQEECGNIKTYIDYTPKITNRLNYEVEGELEDAVWEDIADNVPYRVWDEISDGMSVGSLDEVMDELEDEVWDTL